MSNSIIIIPARMSAVRLPGKPLIDIHGKPMIIHVLERAKEADIGEVLVACAEEEIAEIVEKHGGKAVLTDPNLSSGTDRIHAGLSQIDPDNKYKYILNLQGDLPNIKPSILKTVLNNLQNGENIDITTPICTIKNLEEINNPNVVKAIFIEDTNQAIYFSRSAVPNNAPCYYHHIGVYGYKRASLEKYVSLPSSPLEKIEKLEQLRALENGMHIKVVLVDSIPLTIDTPIDYQKALEVMAKL